MIGRLEGRLHRVDPGKVLIDAGGVGYLVSTTLRAFQELGDDATAVLWIHTQVRDDAIVLFGFPDQEELEAFEKLLAVAGVGPRTALAVLSALPPAELADAVQTKKVHRYLSCFIWGGWVGGEPVRWKSRSGLVVSAVRLLSHLSMSETRFVSGGNTVLIRH